jgi:hypothetical protein
MTTLPWTPTVTPGAAAGSGSTVSVTSGDDFSGVINVTTGTGSSPGTLVTLTYGEPYTLAPTVKLIQITGHWLNASATSTTTTLTLSIAGTPTDATQYSFAFETTAVLNVFPDVLTGPSFFTPTELAYRLQIDPSAINTDTATLLGQLASDAVRQDLGLQVDYVENDTITLIGDYNTVLILPQRPVVNVASVILAGTTLSPYMYGGVAAGTTPMFRWYPDGRLYRAVYGGDTFANMLSWYWPMGVPVTVTYSHGYQIIPSAFKSVALELAAGVYSNPELHNSERIGWVEWATKNTDLNLTEAQKHSLDFYRRVDL